MKKQKLMSQVIVTILAGTLITGMAGCGGRPENSGEKQTETQESQKSEGTEESTKTQGNRETQGNQETQGTGASVQPEEIAYPMQTEDTISVWQANQINFNAAYSGYSESPFHSGLEEMTGVKVDWQQPAQGANIGQAYNLLLTEEVLPDIIYNSISAADAERLIEDGIIYDLTKYLQLYAPDYWEIINRPENEDILKALMTDDGRFYGVGPFPEGDYNVTYVGPVIRKDWLEECNLEEPVTLEDWEEVLTVFKEKYNAGFGFSAGRISSPGIGSGTGAYGTFNAAQFVDDNGTVQLAQVQPEWKEYMEIMHRWYEMGLIDKDSVTMDDAAMRTKVLNNEIGVSFTALSQISNWMLDAQNEKSGAEWIGIEYPRTAPGEPTCMIQTRASRHYGWAAMITTSCPEEKLATALRWLNYGYTREGIMYWNYGKEGVSYTLDENGEAQWTDLVKNDPSGISDAISKYTGVHGTGFSIQQAHFVQIKNTENAANAVYKWIENTTGSKHSVPRVTMTDEESIKYSDKMTAINTRVQEMALKFMTGDESLDKFDDYVAELNEMGLKDCMEIMQAAYERYQAK